MSDDLEDVKSNVRSVLVASLKEGVEAGCFLHEYTSLTCETLTPQKLGFRNLHDLMAAIPDTVRIVNSGGKFFYFAVVNKETAGVANLVSKQRSKRKRGVVSKHKFSRPQPRHTSTFHDVKHSASGNRKVTQPVAPPPQYYQQVPTQLMGPRQSQPVQSSFTQSSYSSGGSYSQRNFEPTPLVNASQTHPGFTDHLYDFERVLTDDEDDLSDISSIEDLEEPPVEEYKRRSPCQKHFELPPQPDLKNVTNKIEAYFTHSYSPMKFFVHLQCEDKVQLIMDMCNEAASSMPDLPNSEIEMGLLILYKCKFDEAWCRAQIVPNDYVLMVDFGSKEPFTRMRAKFFPESLVQYPALARQCCLTAVKPIANVWSKAAKKFFQDNCEEVELWLKIVDFMYVSPDQKNPNLEVDVTLRSGINIGDALVQQKHAVKLNVNDSQPPLPMSEVAPVENQVSSWMDKIEKSPVRKQQQLSVNSGSSEKNVTDELKHDLNLNQEPRPEILESPEATTDDDICWHDFIIETPECGFDPKECVITHVDPTGNVFLQFPLTEGFERLLKLLRKVNTSKEMDKFHNFVSIPEENKLYIVFEKSLHLFLRGEVKKVNRDFVEVEFIDHGYSKIVSRDSVRNADLFNPTFQRLPPQCKKFCLPYVEYKREFYEDYIVYLIENGKRLKCWTVDPEISSVVLQIDQTEKFLYDVLEELNPKSTFDEPCNLYQEYSSLWELEDMTKMFLTSHAKFSRILPVDEIEHDELVTFRVVAVLADKYMKIVSRSNYDKYYKDLKLYLEFECKEQKQCAPLNNLKSGCYFLVRNPVGPSGTDKDCPLEVISGECVPDDQVYTYHRCKMADHTHNFFFCLVDIDTGEFIFSHRSNIFTLSDMFYGAQYPLVSWNASFLFYDQKELPDDLVGKQLTCKAIYPDRSSVSFHLPSEGF